MKTKSLKILGKNIVSVYVHCIMSLEYKPITVSDKSLKMECVTNNPKKIISGTYSPRTTIKVINFNKGKSDVYNLLNDNNKVVGTLSVVYRGGRDLEYKIRNIDAYIYNVRIKENYRGNGYAGEMIKLLMELLHDKGINKVYLAVSKNNKSAIRAYEKVGFKTEQDLSFVRVLKVNIPYRTL